MSSPLSRSPLSRSPRKVLKDTAWQFDSKHLALVLYSTRYGNVRLSEAFHRRFTELSGRELPHNGWVDGSVKVDNPVTARVVQELGPENCGSGIGIALVPRRAMHSVVLEEYDGLETVRLDTNKFIVEELKRRPTLSRAAFDELSAQAAKLRVQVVPVGDANKGTAVRSPVFGDFARGEIRKSNFQVARSPAKTDFLLLHNPFAVLDVPSNL